MFITIGEILDMILMIAVVGFIFMDTFKLQKKTEDVLDKYMHKSSGLFRSFNWHDFWFAAMVVAPSIILHELGHKFTAMSYGLSATFNAAYLWLAIAILLKLVNFPIIFFIPAFVSIGGNPSAIQSALIAFAGPGINLFLFVIAYIVLKTQKLNVVKSQFWTLIKNINLFLFIFNMIPIPGFDGFTVFSGLWHVFGL